MLGPLIVDVEGTHLTPGDREILRHPFVGGIILFARNTPDAESVAALAAEVHALRDPPLLVTIDQEGGRVQRLREGVTRLPPMAELGRRWEADRDAALALATDTGWLLAAELLVLGVDVSFAPVVDLGGRSRVIGDRAFHRRPQAVAELALAFQRGMNEAGMHSVGKHFPGHGGVRGDTHVERPVDRRRYADIAQADIEPFRRLIDNGLAAIMMSHVVYADVSEQPASLSRRWVHDVLRRALHFEGAIVADDLSMDAAGTRDTPGARVRAALAAGCDLAPVCNNRRIVESILGEAADLTPAPASALRSMRLLPDRRPARDELASSPRRDATRRALKRLAERRASERGG